MDSDSIESIAVIGAGTMGHGIAQVCAMAGYEVVLRDLRADILERSMANITRMLDLAIKRGKLPDECKAETLRRITRTTRLTDAKNADLVIEAIIENEESKKELFAELGEICKADTILATNTSSISITALGSISKRPKKVVGLHFSYPVALTKLVEVVKGHGTSEETLTTSMGFCERLGKRAIKVNDAPGFVSNRLLMPMINEAAYALMEGVATRESIDGVMTLGLNHPIGPLALADLVGLDVVLSTMNVLYDGFKDSKYRPCPLLRTLVAAGHLGKKTKKGFYDYGK